MSPLDTEALRALCGEAQVNPRAAVEMLDEIGVSHQDCETPHAQALWAAVEASLRAGDQVDLVSILERTRASVPREFAVDILTDTSLGVTRQRLTLLREASLRRQYLDALRCVARVVTDKAQPLALAVSEAARLLSTWTDEATVLRPLDSTMAQLVDELEAVASGKRPPVLATGIDALDAVIGGMQPTLTMVGALPGVGKSALVAGVVHHLAARGVTVGFMSLEDEAAWLPRRLLALEAHVPAFVLANRRLGSNQRDRVASAWGRLNEQLRHVLVDDRPALTTADVVASARRMVSRGAKAVIIDHLGEIALQRSERHDLDIDACLRDLRAVAKTYRVPVWVLSHLRRREGLTIFDEPRASDFAFSSASERKARVALGLYREKGRDDSLSVVVMKQTQGAAGVTLSLNLDAASGVVVDTAATKEQREMYGADDE